MRLHQLLNAPIKTSDIAAQGGQQRHQALRLQHACLHYRLFAGSRYGLIDRGDAFVDEILVSAVVLVKESAQYQRIGALEFFQGGPRTNKSPTSGVVTSSNQLRICGK